MSDADRAADLAHAEWDAERRELAALRERDDTRAIARELAAAATSVRQVMQDKWPNVGSISEMEAMLPAFDALAALDAALTRAREAGIIGDE